MITFVTPQIAIGDSQDARKVSHQLDKDNFDATLNVAIDLDIEDKVDDVVRGRLRRHKVGLIDGHGNDPLRVVAAVVLLHSMIRQNLKVLVHCHAGQSRSVQIVAAYCDVTGIAPFNEALPRILALRKVDNVRDGLYSTVSTVLPIIKKVLELENDYGKNK